MNVGQIRNQLYVVQDEVQLTIENLSEYKDYLDSELVDSIIYSLARWYENTPPVQNETFTFSIEADLVQAKPSVQRLVQAFISVDKIVNINFIG